MSSSPSTESGLDGGIATLTHLSFGLHIYGKQVDGRWDTTYVFPEPAEAMI
jgi:hypothetical protein